MLITNAKTRRWTVEEFDRLSESGFLAEDERVELIDGEIVVMSPPGSEHSYSIGYGNNRLVELYGSTHIVSVQCPLVQGGYSQPQPDFALIPLANVRSDSHAGSADLVIEVSRSSLAFDRSEKAAVYARAGIADYWIVNLVDRQLEVYRDPGPLPESKAGVGFRSRQILGLDDTVQPLLVPGPPFPVSTFFG